MKFFYQNKKTAVLPAILVGLSIISSVAHASNIKRSCSATYRTMVDSVTFNSRTVKLPYNFAYAGYTSDSFSAEGGCGKLVPNRCRKRARNKLLACARAHVKSPGNLPQECRPNKIKRYPGANLQSIIKAKVCKSRLPVKKVPTFGIREFLPSHYQVNVLLEIFVSGNEGCGVKTPGVVSLENQRHFRDRYPREGDTFFINEPLKHFSISCP